MSIWWWKSLKFDVCVSINNREGQNERSKTAIIMIKKKNNFCVNGWIMMFCWHSMKRRTVYDFNYIRYENVYLIIIFSHWKFIIHHFLSHPLEKSTSVWIIKMLRNRYLLHISAFPMSITKHWKMRKKYDEINETKYRFY